MKDYHAILGVDKGASPEEIKQAYRKLALKWHPDTCKEPNADKKFKEVKEAYENLTNPQQSNTFSRDDFAGFRNMHVRFRERMKQQASQPMRGSNLIATVLFDYEEAMGTPPFERDVQIERIEACRDCNGTGAKDPSESKTTCEECNGTGTVEITKSFGNVKTHQITTCPNCEGSGKSVSQDNICPRCSGQGYEKIVKTINVKIPYFMHGGKIRIKHEGNVGKNGGPRGDLYIVLELKEHSVFKPVDLSKGHIGLELNVTPSEVVCEEEKEVPLPDGTKKNIKLNKDLVSDNQFLELKQKGLPIGPNSRGSFIVVFKLKFTEDISDEEIKLWNQIRDKERNCNLNPELIKYMSQSQGEVHV
jgi:molecular chaperone DnaJ